MLNNTRDRILMMNPVRINHALNKFKLPENKSYSQYALNNSLDGYFQGGNQKVWDGILFEIKREQKNNTLILLSEMYLKIRLLFSKKPEGSADDFFESVKSSLSEIQIKEYDSKDFDKIVSKLEITGQKIERDKIASEKRIIDYESIINKSGFNKSITEDELIVFIKKTRKGLCLEELQYFKYDIPAEVVDKIRIAEELNVFDNFYVFHFDPSAKANVFHEKEKDPIVFGVIQGSTKLYFIADWISDYCNLRFDLIVANNR